ncbi:fasciclin domain-containing protein [Bacteroides luti]|nr:fasciclin domain-containing protein [Bacteroides luti]
MKSKNIIPLLFVLFSVTTFFSSCNDQWDNHIAIIDKTLSGNVLEAIQSNPDLSIFYGMVKAVGYDSLLQSANNFTVLAPSNSALSTYANSSDDVKKSIVKNHIAYLTYNSTQLAALSKIKMINGKNLDLSNVNISSSKDLLCNNGIVHVVNNAIIPNLNIYEYLESIRGQYTQVDELLSMTKKVMDKQRSVQTGVDENGNVLYDTAWVYKNHYLDKMALSNEDSLYTMVLLDNGNFSTLKTKYAKYMVRGSQQVTDSIATDELIQDLVFLPKNAIGTVYTSINGVKVDLANATLSNQYIASNGTVKVMTGANIVMKENKIKTIIVEGESLYGALRSDYVLKRVRTWASGGNDVMFSGWLQQSRDSLAADGTKKTITYNYNYESNHYSDAVNFYLAYLVKLYSVDYDIYWKTYDDMSSHYKGDAYDPSYSPLDPEAFCSSVMKLTQKLFISLPGQPRLARDSDGKILNNYLDTNTGTASWKKYAFVGEVNAGVNKETQLTKRNLTGDFGSVGTVLTDDPYTFQCPIMGYSTFYVCNTPAATKNTEKYYGMIFLDYIRLVPKISE